MMYYSWQVTSDHKWNIAAISGLELTNTLPLRIQKRLREIEWLNNFHHATPSPKAKYSKPLAIV